MSLRSFLVVVLLLGLLASQGVAASAGSSSSRCTAAPQFFEYTLTNATAGATCTRVIPDGKGWILLDRECLMNGTSCQSEVCLWRHTSAKPLSYTLTACDREVEQAHLKAQLCATPGRTPPVPCPSAVCLWESDGEPASGRVALSHIGGKDGGNLDCARVPVIPYDARSRVCILRSEAGCYSDLCLWSQLQTSCAASASSALTSSSATSPALVASTSSAPSRETTPDASSGMLPQVLAIAAVAAVLTLWLQRRR